MCEISHEPILNVGVVGDTTQDLGTLKCSLWVGAAVVQIPVQEKHRSPSSSTVLNKLVFERVVFIKYNLK